MRVVFDGVDNSGRTELSQRTYLDFEKIRDAEVVFIGGSASESITTFPSLLDLEARIKDQKEIMASYAARDFDEVMSLANKKIIYNGSLLTHYALYMAYVRKVSAGIKEDDFEANIYNGERSVGGIMSSCDFIFKLDPKPEATQLDIEADSEINRLLKVLSLRHVRLYTKYKEEKEWHRNIDDWYERVKREIGMP